MIINKVSKMYRFLYLIIAITFGYWVEAKDLREGDVFIGANGELSILISAERVVFPEGIKVYNFTVDGNHNYFVIAKCDEFGQTCVLVHNAGLKDYLLPTGNVIDKNHLTKAGRALQKHGSRPNSTYPHVSGTASQINSAGTKVLETILDSTGKWFRKNNKGGIDIMDKITGWGARLHTNLLKKV